MDDDARREQAASRIWRELAALLQTRDRYLAWREEAKRARDTPSYRLAQEWLDTADAFIETHGRKFVAEARRQIQSVRNPRSAVVRSRMLPVNQLLREALTEAKTRGVRVDGLDATATASLVTALTATTLPPTMDNIGTLADALGGDASALDRLVDVVEGDGGGKATRRARFKKAAEILADKGPEQGARYLTAALFNVDERTVRNRR